MKVAKILTGLNKDKFLVNDPTLGWLDGSGASVTPQASMRHTKFYKTLTDAKNDGFSPSAKQAETIAKWDAPTVKAAPATK